MSTISISGDVLSCQLDPKSGDSSSPRTHSAHRSLDECIRIAAFDYHDQLRPDPSPTSLPQVRLQAVIRPRLDGDTNTFDLAQLGKSGTFSLSMLLHDGVSLLDGLVDILARMSTQGIMESGDELVSIILRHGHECTAHQAALSAVTTWHRQAI